jgi:hypothetical protein
MQVQVEASSVRPPAMEVDPPTSSPPLPFQVRLLPVVGKVASVQLPVAFKVADSELHGFAGLGSGSGSRLELMDTKPKMD